MLVFGGSLSEDVRSGLLVEEGVHSLDGFRGWYALGSQGCDLIWSPQQGISKSPEVEGLWGSVGAGLAWGCGVAAAGGRGAYLA